MNDDTAGNETDQSIEVPKPSAEKDEAKKLRRELREKAERGETEKRPEARAGGRGDGLETR